MITPIKDYNSFVNEQGMNEFKDFTDKEIDCILKYVKDPDDIENPRYENIIIAGIANDEEIPAKIRKSILKKYGIKESLNESDKSKDIKALLNAKNDAERKRILINKFSDEYGGVEATDFSYTDYEEEAFKLLNDMTKKGILKDKMGGDNIGYWKIVGLKKNKNINEGEDWADSKALVSWMGDYDEGSSFDTEIEKHLKTKVQNIIGVDTENNDYDFVDSTYDLIESKGRRISEFSISDGFDTWFFEIYSYNGMKIALGTMQGISTIIIDKKFKSKLEKLGVNESRDIKDSLISEKVSKDEIQGYINNMVNGISGFTYLIKKNKVENEFKDFMKYGPLLLKAITKGDYNLFEGDRESINEGTTETFKRFIKKAKSQGIDNADDLRNLMGEDEFANAVPFLSGADYEIAKKMLKIRESINESMEETIKSILKKAHGEDYSDEIANKMIKDLKKEHGDDEGAIIGIVQNSLGESIDESYGNILDQMFEGLDVKSGNVGGGVFYITINTRNYGYKIDKENSKETDLKEVKRKFDKMAKFSPGRALAWLKKNTILVSGSKKEEKKQLVKDSYNQGLFENLIDMALSGKDVDDLIENLVNEDIQIKGSGWEGMIDDRSKVIDLEFSKKSDDISKLGNNKKTKLKDLINAKLKLFGYAIADDRPHSFGNDWAQIHIVKESLY